MPKAEPGIAVFGPEVIDLHVQADPVWRLPLHQPYRKFLDSKVADISSTGGEGLGGAITAALFLKEFVKEAPRWVVVQVVRSRKSLRF